MHRGRVLSETSLTADLLLPPDVAARGLHPAQPRHVPGRGPHLVLVPGGDDDARPEAQQLLGYRLPDPSPASWRQQEW